MLFTCLFVSCLSTQASCPLQKATVAHCSADMSDFKICPTLSFTWELPDLLFRGALGFPAATFGLSDESPWGLACAGAQ